MEIRYRVWDGKKMYYPQGGTFTVSQIGVVSLGSEVGLPDLPTECVAMLSTGMKDESGREIFEGDIVKVSFSEWDRDKHIYAKYNEVGFIKWMGFKCGWMIATSEEKFFDLFIGAMGFEVIGDKYENPDMLKGD